jgi:hypothetical protein
MQAILILLLLTNNFCNNTLESGQISEGEIEYKVKYNENGHNNLLIALLPTQVTTYFKENSSCTLIEGDLGLFKLSYILNGNDHKSYSLLQIIDKKYVYESEYGKPTFGYDKMDGLKIVQTERNKKIAGYNCNHALAIFNNSLDTINLYYTNEIQLLHPNLNNPFKEIDGVLLEFSVTLAGIEMKFIANKIRSISVEEKRFSLPEGYLSITEEQMQEEINKYYYSPDK